MDSSQLKCPMCETHFNSQEELELHAKQMHSKTEEHKEEHAITCSKCGLKVKTADKVGEHSCETC